VASVTYTIAPCCVIPLRELKLAVVELVSTNGALTLICPTADRFKSFADCIVAAPTEDTVKLLTDKVPIVYVPVPNALTVPTLPVYPLVPALPEYPIPANAPEMP